MAAFRFSSNNNYTLFYQKKSGIPSFFAEIPCSIRLATLVGHQEKSIADGMCR